MQEHTIVLVHGLWEIPLLMKILGSRLKKQKYRVVYFSYHSVLSHFSDNTERLFAFVKQQNADHIHLVGHSLGGLMILALLDRYSVANIKRSVIFGCPVNGSSAVRNIGERFFGKALFGKSYEPLSKGYQPLCHYDVGIIAGTGGVGLGHFFTDFSKPHDGAISIEEALIQDDTHFIQMPVSHFNMLFSADVAHAIASFIKNGEFKSA